MPFLWDDAGEKRLALTVLANIPNAGHEWATIASQMGEGLTAEAVRQKFAKIKKRDADIFNGAAAAGSASASTPVKPKATPKRGRAKTAAANGDVDDDEEEGSPVKKAKKGAKKERKESVDDDEDGSPVKDEPEGV
ncbi:hypothetical protein FKW77_007140 [Venturia effusa]|uniref:Myb-like domain-containing protein n=1 Tax=Venturia effusa TaxID=50376 RepID=A0A517L3M0_9PEZI|nr:hypothetical protein FKW77_007140 [Venturia effusa]